MSITSRKFKKKKNTTMKATPAGKNAAVKRGAFCYHRSLPEENVLIDSKDKVAASFVGNHAIHDFPAAAAAQVPPADVELPGQLNRSLLYHHPRAAAPTNFAPRQSFNTGSPVAVTFFSFTSS